MRFLHKMKKTSLEDGGILEEELLRDGQHAPPFCEHVWGNPSPVFDPGYWEGAGEKDQRSSPKERDRLTA